MRPILPVLIAVAVLGAACGGGGSSARSQTPAPPIPPTPTPPLDPVPTELFCAADASCPELLVTGDPYATKADGSPAAFRGYGDPSLEYDATTDTLWMSYSWLEVLNELEVSPGVPFPYQAINIHLARSTDGGATFEFVREVAEAVVVQHPVSAEEGYRRQETSTLVRESDTSWQLLWFQVLDILGDPPQGIVYVRSVADSPEALGDTSEVRIRGAGTSSAFGGQINLSDVPELSQCTAFTEPSFLRHQGETWLSTSCVVNDNTGQRRPEQEQIALLRQDGDSYTYIGPLTDGLDPADLGALILLQGDLSVSRDGAVLLTVTPLDTNSAPQQLGCVVLEVEDLATASIRRGSDSALLPRAIITAEGGLIGPGLCTYDAANDAGLLLVIPQAVSSGTLFTIRQTGLHP